MLKILSIMAVLLFSSFSYSEELTDEKKKVVDEMLEITGALKIGEMMGNAVAKNMIMSLQQQKQEITPEIAAVIQDEIGKLMHDGRSKTWHEPRSSYSATYASSFC